LLFFAKDLPMPNDNRCTAYTPPISYQKAAVSYFIHEHTVYTVDSAPSEVFKAAIEKAMDTRQLSVLTGAIEEAHDILAGDLDLFARWWLLSYVALQNTARPLKLYASVGEAERALRVVV
jgi:hypothetical protein